MTEPQGGSDPTLFTTTAVRDGDEWILNGEKWFNSEARHAAFWIVMAVTNPDVSPYQGMSMLIVDPNAPGVEIVRNITVHGFSEDEAYTRFTNARIPAENMLGAEGAAFAIAQTRLGGGRVHHAMRTVAQVRKAFDMMCERVISRAARGGTIAKLQMTQERIADSWIEMESFRLLVLRTAWLIDKHQDYLLVRKDIAAIKAAMPKVMHDVAQRALHLHGSLGVSEEMPLAKMFLYSEVMGLVDGPTEVHKVTIAKEVLKDYTPYDGLFPPSHIPALTEKARAHVAARLEHRVGNL